MQTSLKFLVIPLAVGALFFAGCGSDDSSDDSTSNDTPAQTQPAEDTANTNGAENGGQAEVLEIAADPSGALAYDTTELSANAGKIKIDFTNDSPVPHDVVIRDSGGKELAATEVVTSANSSTEFDAKPGKYTFFCSVPGHEAGGMKGTLTVK